MNFCEIHFAELLGHTLRDVSDVISGRGSDSKKQDFNKVYLARANMIFQTVL